MSKAVGLAIRISPANAHLLKVVNNGLEPYADIEVEHDVYFIVPLEPDLENMILPGCEFRQHFRFTSPRSDHYLVPVELIPS